MTGEDRPCKKVYAECQANRTSTHEIHVARGTASRSLLRLNPRPAAAHQLLHFDHARHALLRIAFGRIGRSSRSRSFGCCGPERARLGDVAGTVSGLHSSHDLTCEPHKERYLGRGMTDQLMLRRRPGPVSSRRCGPRQEMSPRGDPPRGDRPHVEREAGRSGAVGS